MAIRKYLFYKNASGIRTYKVVDKGMCKLMKPSGKDFFPSVLWNEFFNWFNKCAAIASDDHVDYCFLSEERVESPKLNVHASSYSSWDKQEILTFIRENITGNAVKVYYKNTEFFTCQTGDVLNDGDIKNIYLKCIPEFSIDTEEIIDEGTEETSILNKYFIEKLKEYGG